MTLITFPRTDILTFTGFSDQTFMLQSRQEFSRAASGVTIGKDLGPALWMADYTTQPMPNDDALVFEAMLNSLDGVVNLFEAFDLRRPMPKMYPTGACSDGVLHSVATNNKQLSLSDLNAGQIVSAGDYLSFDYGDSRALHQAMETVVADGSGVTAEFEVRPHIRPVALSPAVDVTLKGPAGLFALVPGSVSVRSNGALHTVVSFQGMQFLA
jgi:hypothetical protein